MDNIIDQLDDNTKYRAECDFVYFCEEGDVMTGKEIKESIPFDISPNQPIETFFTKVN